MLTVDEIEKFVLPGIRQPTHAGTSAAGSR
jgi:hypothetical protein